MNIESKLKKLERQVGDDRPTLDEWMHNPDLCDKGISEDLKDFIEWLEQRRK